MDPSTVGIEHHIAVDNIMPPALVPDIGHAPQVQVHAPGEDLLAVGGQGRALLVVEDVELAEVAYHGQAGHGGEEVEVAGLAGDREGRLVVGGVPVDAEQIRVERAGF